MHLERRLNRLYNSAMGIPTCIPTIGEDCFCFPEGQTPKFVYACFTGIVVLDRSQDNNLPLIVNKWYKCEQVPYDYCTYVYNNLPGIEVQVVLRTGYCTMKTGAYYYFHHGNAGACTVYYVNQLPGAFPNVNGTGGCCLIAWIPLT